jgi:hypothetical protein
MTRNLHVTFRSFIGILFMLLAWNGWGQTTPCNATVFNPTSGSCMSVSANNNTIDIMPDCTGSGTVGQETWIQYTPSTTGPFNINITGISGNNTALAIYEGTPTGDCDVSDMTLISCANYNDANGSQERIRPIELEAGVTYYIQVFKYTTSGGTGTSLCINALEYFDISTCSSTFTDTGASGNYPNNAQQVWTYCSNDPANPYVTVNFSSFQLENGTFDYMTIFDGDGFNNVILGVYTSTENPGTITSSTGCLTFYFTSDGSVTAPGWSAAITCTDEQGTLPTPTISDCLGAIGLCENTTVNTQGSVTGTGNYEDLSQANQGCLRGEHNSIWYFVKIDDADGDGDPNTVGTGTFGFTLTYPQQYEYDYAVWGPLEGDSPTDFCTPYLPPSRCSYETATGNSSVTVGLGSQGGNQVYETGSPSDDGWVYWYDDVQNGDIFVILIDEYYGNIHQYNLNFTGTAGTGSGGLDCTITTLPSELVFFEAYNTGGQNILNWQTASEINSDFIQVERSKTGFNWEIIGSVRAAGNSNQIINYNFFDNDFARPLSYYRLKFVDTDGQFKYSPTRAVSSDLKISGLFSDIFPNPANESFYMIYGGGNSEESIEVSIVSVNGSVVFENVFSNISKSQGIEIPTSTLANGMYQVIIRQGDYQEIKKISVIH